MKNHTIFIFGVELYNYVEYKARPIRGDFKVSLTRISYSFKRQINLY